MFHSGYHVLQRGLDKVKVCPKSDGIRSYSIQGMAKGTETFYLTKRTRDVVRKGHLFHVEEGAYLLCAA